MDAKSLAKYLDLANHRQEASEEDIKKLSRDVLLYGFHSAFVNPFYVPLVRELLVGQAAVGTVISFPLGQESQEIKIASSVWAVKNGADELDQAINVGLFKQGKGDNVLEELKRIIAAAKEIKPTTVVKFIIEAGCYDDDQIKKLAEIILLSGADFIKICSGMGPRGVNLTDVGLVKAAVGNKIKIKVAGGISTLSQATGFIDAGASRIGTSHATNIIEEFKSFYGIK